MTCQVVLSLAHLLRQQSVSYDDEKDAQKGTSGAIGRAEELDVYLARGRDALDVEVHVLSTPQLVQLCEAAGWREVRAVQVPDPRPHKPAEAFTPNEWEPSHALHVAARRAGSLVITARR